jgi:Domain of unknown function (DUF4258)
MIRIRYSSHALDRLRERDISRDEIENAVQSGMRSDAEGGSRKVRHRNENGVLVVIYSVRNSEEVEIITVYRE